VRGKETVILCAAIQQRGRNIILNLREIDSIDAAGVGVLISLQAAGIYLKLMNPSKAVREVLRLTKLDSVFEIYDSRANDGVIEEGGAENNAAATIAAQVRAATD